MNLDVRKQLDQFLEELDSSWTPEQRKVAVDVGESYAKLLTRQLSGEDVDAELRDLQAAARNLTVGAVMSAQTAGLAVLQRMVEWLLDRMKA